MVFEGRSCQSTGPRKEAIDETAVGIVYRGTASIAACGERFCAGGDAVSGRNFGHRKAWVRERLKVLAGEAAFGESRSALRLGRAIH